MFKLVDKDSGPGAHSGFRVFGVPPSNISITKSHWREILPLSTSNNDTQFDFRHFSDDQWLDLRNVYAHFHLLLEKRGDDGRWTALETADTHVGVVQTPGQSVFKTVKLFINGDEFSSENLYPYMCYMKNALSWSEDVRTTRLASAGYFKTDTQNAATDSGFVKRVALFAGGKAAEFVSKLEFDLSNQDRFLLNNLDIVFSLYKADDDFLVHALRANDANTYRFRIKDIRLYVKCVDAMPEVNNSINSILQSGNVAKYPFRRTEMRSVFVSIGRTEFVHNIFTNTVPLRLTIGFVANNAYAGNRTLDPFRFVNANVRSIAVSANGLEYPSVRYDLRFTDALRPVYVKAFVDLHEASGLLRKNVTNGITLEKFHNGWTFFVIPMTSTLDDTGGFEPVRNGTTTIKVTFNTAVQDPGYSMIVMGEFDACAYFDESRTIASDSAV